MKTRRFLLKKHYKGVLRPIVWFVDGLAKTYQVSAPPPVAPGLEWTYDVSLAIEKAVSAPRNALLRRLSHE